MKAVLVTTEFRGYGTCLVTALSNAIDAALEAAEKRSDPNYPFGHLFNEDGTVK